MSELRNLTAAERVAVESGGSSAADWSQIYVAGDFSPAQIVQSRLEGRVELASGARITRSLVRNYRLGEGAAVECTALLECRHESSFGNGTAVATVNECGGRTVRIFDSMSAQTAYIAALYRHRPALAERLDRMAEEIAVERRAETGEVGAGSRITGAGIIREVRIGRNVTVDGASMLVNGTLCDGAVIGADAKCEDFIAAEDSLIAGGATVERCFVGECVILDKGFTASDSLFFANSHCENGEAASIFAGPYTVSHHKSTLLIAGMFSFFNAGSASNQSNHLFKSGAVHQAVHLRGCKFASGAYIMAPAIEGAFTMAMGHHSNHHDTADFPYSYLLERDGRSQLLPAMNLTSYGAVRDVEKWPLRDRRKIRRDVVDFDEYNPYIGGAVVRGLDTLHTLVEENPGAQHYVTGKVQIGAAAAQRGIKLYNKYIVAALGALLDKGSDNERYDGRGRWTDIAGQYITRAEVERIVDGIESGTLDTPAKIDNAFRVFHLHYDDYARSWAFALYGSMLGHAPSEEDIREAIEAGRNAHAAMRRTADADRDRDCSEEMSVGYGVDGDDETRRRDYRAVRGLN